MNVCHTVCRRHEQLLLKLLQCGCGVAMCQETRFPTQDREDFDSDGSKMVISEPIGPACLRCS
jgi:hypothetical protein